MTKYRYKVLTGDVAERIRELVREACEAFEIRIVKGVVSKDHVHILVSCPPNMAPSEIMRRIKGRTLSKLFEEFSHLKKRYWGRLFWARGYFCATVGQMTEAMILKNSVGRSFLLETLMGQGFQLFSFNCSAGGVKTAETLTGKGFPPKNMNQLRFLG